MPSISESTFSYSRLSTFKTCREQYKIIYLDGIRRKDESIEAFTGKCVHSTLEWLYQPKNRDRPYITFDRICQKYDDIWREMWHDKIFIVERYLESDHYYAVGKRCLANYYNNYGPIFDEKVYATELELEFVIDENINSEALLIDWINLHQGYGSYTIINLAKEP